MRTGSREQHSRAVGSCPHTAQNYMKPLLIKVRTSVIENVPEEDVKSIFSNVEEFFPINQHMATQFNGTSMRPLVRRL